MANYVLDILVKTTDQASGALGNIGKSLGGLGSAAQQGFGGLQKAVGVGLAGAFGLAAAGVGALGVAFSDSLDLARQQQDVEAQLAAVIKSTGGAAGLSAEQIKGMAKELQSVTNFGDDAILSGQNLLLTFTNIGEDVFPRATETMLDMATALGTDAKSGAIQLGKALNDPTEGISALTRVGVTFTEQQKEQIKAMQEAGDMAGAQTVILDELAKEFGGSARALADPADQLKNAFVDFKEVVGGAVLPLIESLYSKALPLVNRAMGTVTAAINWFTKGLELGLTPLGALQHALYGVFGETGSALAQGVTTILYVSDVLRNLFTDMTFFEDTPQYFMPFVELGDALRPTIQSIGEAITSFISWKDVLIATGVVVASIVLPFLWGLATAAAPVIAVAAALVGAVALLRNAWENDWGGIQELVGGVVESITTAYQGFIDGTLTLPEAIGQAFSGIGAAIAERLPGWIATLQGWATAAWQWVVDAVPVVLAKLGEWATGIIGWLAAQLPEWIATIWEWETAIIEWIGDAIPKAIDSLTNFIESLGSEGDGTGESTFVPMVGKWVSLLIDWVVNDLIPKVGPAFLDLSIALLEALGQIGLALGRLALTIGNTVLEQLLAGMKAGWNAVVAWFGTLRLPDLNPFNNGAPGYATGTASAGGGWSMVGEAGPELVRLPRGASVATANETRNMLGGMAGGPTYNISIHVPAGATQSDGQNAARGFLAEMRAAGLR